MNSRSFPFIVLLFILFSTAVSAQGVRNVIQFSGLVVGGDSLYGIPGVHVVVPKTGRGTSTNDLGYFTLATLVGDTVEVTALGFKKKNIVVPKSEKQSVTLVIELQEDTAYYPIVEIFPYPTEEAFKEAFLALRLPDDANFARMSSNIDASLLQRMMIKSSMSNTENQKYSLKSQMYPNYVQGFQIFNPYAWSNLVKGIRKNKNKPKVDDSDDDN